MVIDLIRPICPTFVFAKVIHSHRIIGRQIYLFISIFRRVQINLKLSTDDLSCIQGFFLCFFIIIIEVSNRDVRVLYNMNDIINEPIWNFLKVIGEFSFVLLLIRFLFIYLFIFNEEMGFPFQYTFYLKGRK